MSDSNAPISFSSAEPLPYLLRPEGRRPGERYWLHLVLFTLTCFTTLVVGAKMEFNFQHDRAPFAAGNEYIPFFDVRWVLAEPSRLLLGLPFAGSLLLILMAHEMGHYLCCRYYGVRATLPFFIPAPTLIGTLGAVIRIKAPIPSRAALFDIGIAGPIAGFVVAVGTLGVALGLSKPLTPGMGAPDLAIGFPHIFFLMHHLIRHIAPGYSIAGLPLTRVYLHPTAIAAWVGMLATALNLLPSGQLDGGHIVYAVAPRVHRAFSVVTIAVLVGLGFIYVGWWMWAGMILVLNIIGWKQEQAPASPTLPMSRWPLAALAVLMLAVTFTVTPFQLLWK